MVEVRWKSQRWHVLIDGATVAIHAARPDAIKDAARKAAATNTTVSVFRKDGSPDPYS